MRSILVIAAAAVGTAVPCHLSNTFGDHMVLQRAPASAMLFGLADAGTEIKTTFAGTTYTATTDATNVWRQALPPTPASSSAQNITFSCASGEKFSLNDVLFGEVAICGGQSNMQFTLSCIGFELGYNATEEIAESAAYPLVRTMTVGETTTSYYPLQELAVPPTLPWTVAGSAAFPGNWSATSAVCWFYGRYLFDALQVPIGLVSSNWGGTIIQSWSDNSTNELCSTEDASVAKQAQRNALDFVSPGFEEAVGAGPNPNSGFGVLFNAMINPFAVGPMTISSIIWFQGESNNGDAQYGCRQSAMITSWRRYFNAPSAFFGFVVMEPWIGGPSPTFRAIQMQSAGLPYVGYAAGMDIGDPTGPFGSVHPRNKKLIGRRLANAALSVQYNQPMPYLAPTYAGGVASAAGTTVSVAVSFTNVPTSLVTAEDHCATELGVPVATCAWFSITASDGKTYNATATIGADGKSVVLSATVAAAGTTAVSTAFGIAGWPINTIKSAEGLPLFPWSNSTN